MSRQFDWLVLGSWAAIILALIVFWVGLVVVMMWFA
jgi:hypothetical protein